MSNDAVPSMSFVKAIRTVFSKYVTFSGRARRRELCYWSLFCYSVFAIAGISDGILNSIIPSLSDNSYGVFGCSALLVLILPSIGVFVRRLHDIGKSGWWWPITFVPYLGGIVLLILCCINSQKGANKYGESPKEPAQALAEE